MKSYSGGGTMQPPEGQGQASASVQLSVSSNSNASSNAIAGELSSASLPTYWRELDGLRTIAFLLVFLHHSPVFPAAINLPWLAASVTSVASWGWAGVDLFFVLSGFLITTLLLQEKLKFGSISLKFFYARRAIRIWPAYYLVLFVLCFAIPYAQGISFQPEFQRFVLAQVIPLSLFLGNVSLTFSLGSLVEVGKLTAYPLTNAVMPLWSLAVEEQFYLTWPLIVMLVKKPRNILKWAGALLVVSIASRAVLWSDSRTTMLSQLPAPHTAYYHCTLAHLDGLMIGAIIAITAVYYPKVFAKLAEFNRIWLAGGIAILATIAACAPSLTLNTAFNVPLFTLIAFAFGMLLIAAFSCNWWKAILSTPLLSGPGKVTYCMYLIHYAVLAAVGILLSGTKLEPSLGWMLHVCGALLATYLLSLVSWWALESRCLSLRKYFRRG